MEIIAAMMVLGSFLLMCTGVFLAVWLLSDKPLVSVTVQVATAPVPPAQVVLKQRANQVFA